MNENAELEPRFLVTVTLDGEEWPPTATEQAEIELRRALDTIDLRGGVIRAYTIEQCSTETWTTNTHVIRCRYCDHVWELRS